MRTFRKLGFDLSYLALLTKEHLKPLSRWEGRFSRGQVKAIRHLGLMTDTVDRKLLNGGTTTELIFSNSSRYLSLYSRRFHRTPIRKDKQTVKTQGFLFGYPACCVRNFAENGYTRNEFQGCGQEILFHWACPGCRATPELLPYYRKIHDQCHQMLMAEKTSAPELIKRSLPAATLALLFALIPGRARAEDPHWYSPSAIDTTGDFLADHEELLLGAVWGGFPDGLPNGPREAPEFSAIISSLPRAPADSCCYLEEVPMDGIENCIVCGLEMTMGGWLLHNPMRGDTLFLSNMALHYMEHSSFSFDGTTNAGRVEIEHLKSILAHYDTDHYAIETTNDSDDDGLRDDYEDDFGTHIGISDSDSDGLDDGAQVAECLIEAISQLPESSVIFHIAYGLEQCNICGMEINMGEVQIVNPFNGDDIYFPIIGLHYLAHGRLAYDGTDNCGEIDAIQLAQVLDILTWRPNGPAQPREYQLFLSSRPNPFNAGTQITFRLPKPGHTSLKIFNINGQLVQELLAEHLSAGDHQMNWNGQDDSGQPVASGIYFCRLEHDEAMLSTKMMLVK